MGLRNEKKNQLKIVSGILSFRILYCLFQIIATFCVRFGGILSNYNHIIIK